MKIVKKIFLCILVLIINLSVSVYASYNYTYNFKAFSLTRDVSPIIYNIRRNIDDEIYTNSDVILSIDLNKPVDKIDGFDISEDGMKLTKTIKENETQTIVVEDVSGNKCEIPYTVSNIDKISPEILGVENSGTYKMPKTIDYKDNVGIKNIYIDKYSTLKWELFDDYYDTSFHRGTDLTKNSILVCLKAHPKNTSYYKYYLDGNLKAQTPQNKFKITGLNPGIIYQVKVEALDKNNNVLQTVTKQVRTKYYNDMSGEKGANTFKVTLYGLDSKVQRATATANSAINPDNYRFYDNLVINPDRSLTFTFSALEINSSIGNEYYYFHIQLWNNETKLDTVCCNIIFNTNWIENNGEIDPRNLIEAGNYEIIVTDIAGNSTTKDITITE